MAEADAGIARYGLDALVKERASALLLRLEATLGADVLTSFGPISPGLDAKLRTVLELTPHPRPRLAIILTTPGGVVEVVERMVDLIRARHSEVIFLIPDAAMSAGTVLAMSGDAIYMDEFSRLGPIDPQIVKNGKLVPALSYVAQYRRFLKRARAGRLSEGEFALWASMDLAELHAFEEATKLTLSLLRVWLVRYKFKGWVKTEGRGIDVTPEMREDRAEAIARALTRQSRWHTHGRGISKRTLESEEFKLKIDDLASVPGLPPLLREYHALLTDYVIRLRPDLTGFMHTREFF